MLALKHIKKSYGKQQVLDDFNYYFSDSGFYLLFGPSGCGKTTLLNLIAGIIQPDEGKIYIHDEVMHENELHSELGYIMQDAYFVDYLTMRENLMLTSFDEQRMNDLAKRLHVEKQMAQFPETLSGGEKQRFSILQTLLAKKKIMLLDEPTASLDEENKRLIFQILKDIKDEILILCVSHDACAKEYCETVIDFLHLDDYKKQIEIEKSTVSHVVTPAYQVDNLYSYIKRQSRKKEKFSLILFGMIMTISFLICNLTLDIEDKLTSMLGEVYHYNYLSAEIPNTVMEEIKQREDIISIVYPYKIGADYLEQNTDSDSVVVKIDENLGMEFLETLRYETLPRNGFYYQDHLAAGDYFTKANQIMLGYDYALNLNQDLDELIKTSITLSTNEGKKQFEIAGVFLPFEKESMYYIQNGYDKNNINQILFFNDAYANQYLYDHRESDYEKNHKGKNKYLLYFDSFNSMNHFYETYKDNKIDDLNQIYVKPITSSFSDTIELYHNLSMGFIPASMIALLFSASFYIFSRKQYFLHSIKNMSVYQYHGYTWNTLMKYQIRYQLHEIAYTLLLSIGITFVLSIGFNFLNRIVQFLPFYPFLTSPTYFILTGVCSFIGFSIMMIVCFIRLKQTNWYDYLRTRRDLL